MKREGRDLTIVMQWQGLSGPVTAGHLHCCAAPGQDALLAFVGVAVTAKGWVDDTGPLQGFDDMATLEDMGLKPAADSVSADEAQRCEVPAFAKAKPGERYTGEMLRRVSLQTRSMTWRASTSTLRARR